jgi:hypothetical protein
MSILDKLANVILSTKNKFIAVCTNANRDLPFHDYNVADMSADGSYVVGSNQIEGTGDQKKFFVSKSTLFYCTVDSTIQLNSKNNIAIVLLANTWYTFKSNIHSVFWTGNGQREDVLKMYFEGVMYNEARRPE